MTKLTAVLALALVGLGSATNAGGGLGVIAVPGASGALQQTTTDSFRKGVHADANDRIGQHDAESSKQSYDRGNTAHESASKSSIAQGLLGDGVGIGAGAGSTGMQSRALGTTFDRGALDSARTRDVVQRASSDSNALDSGSQRAQLASTSRISPFGSSGVFNGREARSRTQTTDAADHLDQFAEDDATKSERFDRGSTNKAAASTALIGQASGIDVAGPFGGVGSAGTDLAEFATTRDRGAMTDAARTTATKTANNVGSTLNDQALTKNRASTASILTPLGSSGSLVAGLNDRSQQRADQHRDLAESQTTAASTSKQLDSDWTKHSRASEVGLEAGLAGPGVSAGKSKAAFLDGHDRSFLQGDALSSATKTATSDSNAFDDRSHDQELTSNTVLGIGHV